MSEKMYLVSGRLTDKQKLALQKHVDAYDFNKALGAIGTPVQPCADVETVGYVLSDILEKMLEGKYSGINISKDRNTSASCIAWGSENIPLVRRTDMEAQVARVAAEKDAEIGRLREALTFIANTDTVDNNIDPDRNVRVARAALNEGAAG